MSTPTTHEIQIPFAFTDLDEVPIVLANVFSVTPIDPDHDEFVLTIGQISVPVLTGDEEERRRQAGRIKSVSVRPVARVSLTGSRITELIGALQQVLAGMEKIKQGGDE